MHKFEHALHAPMVIEEPGLKCDSDGARYSSARPSRFEARGQREGQSAPVEPAKVSLPRLFVYSKEEIDCICGKETQNDVPESK